MYEANREAPRETCASSSSPCSSPLTPSMDPPQPDPTVADYGKRSATLDNIGAWSSVQATPSTQSAAAISAYSMASEVHTLGKTYGQMTLAQNHATLAPDTAPACADPYVAATMAGASAAGDAGIDLDYSELDEAILRGRSTTLPNIFAVPNPLYRYSAVANPEASAAPGTISPASTFSMLSRHGSISAANNNNSTHTNRTASPLGLSLNAIPIHQTTSLDNQLTSPLEPTSYTAAGRLDMLGGGMLGKANSVISGSVSSTGSLGGIGSVPARRFSEYSADHPSSLALASYSMGSSVFSGSGGSGNAHAEGINSSGVSHDSQSISAGIHSASLQSGPQANASRGGTGAYPKPAVAGRYGGFGLQLPTMREEDALGELSPSQSSGTLMRNASFPNVASPAAAAPRSLGAGSGGAPANMYSAKRVSSSASPENDVADAEASTADWPGASTYLPLRVKSLKDMRRPSLEAHSDAIGDLGIRDPAAPDRSTGMQPTIPFGPFPGMAGMHRRHSLASTHPHFAAPGNVGSGGATPAYVGDYSMYPPHIHPASMAAQQPMLPAGMYPYGVHPGAIPRQNSTSALYSIVGQQPQPQFAMFQPHPGAIPLARTPGPGGMTQPPGVAPRSGFFNGQPAGVSMPSQQPQPPRSQSALTLPPMLTPAHMQLQPSVLQSAQLAQSKQSQAQQQAQNQQHSRRASHSGIPRIGTPAVTLGMMSPVPVLAGGTHQAAAHPMLPNPATTITPNMPFADMGKGLPYQSLTKGTRVFVVQFKGKRCDLYFAPNRGMEHKVIPTLAPTAAKDGAGTGTSATPAPVPPKSRDSEAKSAYEPGTYVLVEADRGVDLGVIREELLGTETVLAFSSGSADASPGGFSDHSTLDGDDAAGDHGGLARPTSSKDVYVKRIFRAADQREVADLLGNKVLDEQNALSMCQAKVQQRKLSMCVVDAEFQFDRRKLTFYFTADRRVDFRELVRDLFKHFKTRIWMCQQTS